MSNSFQLQESWITIRYPSNREKISNTIFLPTWHLFLTATKLNKKEVKKK